jgi:iron complex outermembrane receptor protein
MKTTNKLWRYLSYSAIVTVLLFCMPAGFAADDGARTGVAIEEMIVTARKMEEDLQSTPISIAAFSGDGLEDRGMTNIAQIAPFVPNLSFQNNPSFGGAGNAAAIYIRGVGQKEFLPTTEPGVGLYVDEVYIARSVGGILDLIDIERVEVLRGPQGTLFGRNTNGGAINITTRKPHDEFEGDVIATYGTDSRIDLKGSINAPITESLFSRFSLLYKTQDGYVKRDDGREFGDADTIGGRATFLWQATESLEITLTGEYTREEVDGPALTLIGINLGLPIDPDTPPMATIHNVGANLAAGGGPIPCAIPPAPLNLAVPGCYDNRYVYGEDAERTSGTAPAFSDTDIWGTNLNISWDITDSLTLKSITAYRDLDSQFARDGDHSLHRISQFADDLQQDQFTQEVQLLGESFGDRLKWIVGLYYFTEDGNNVNELDFTVSRFRSGGAFDNESLAAFAQGTFDVTSRLHLTAGLRYTDETKKFTPDQIIHENYFAGSGHPQLDAPFMQAGQRILPMLEKELDVEELDPYLNVSFDITDTLMAYVSYSEGFKSGGFTQRVFPPIVVPFTAPPGTADIDLIPTFDPEFVKVYELGAKYTGFDNRFRLNGAIFYTDYTDMQIQVFTSVAPITKNAGEATIKGFELETQIVPLESWFVEAGIGYLDAGYDEIDFATTFVDKNNNLDRVSDWTLSSATFYEIAIGGAGTITPRLEWAYRSEFDNDAFNTPQIHQDDYHLVNANVAWQNSDATISVIAGVTNLTDENYLITGIIGDAFQSYEGLYDRGRQYYLTANFGF